MVFFVGILGKNIVRKHPTRIGIKQMLADISTSPRHPFFQFAEV